MVWPERLYASMCWIFTENNFFEGITTELLTALAINGTAVLLNSVMRVVPRDVALTFYCFCRFSFYCVHITTGVFFHLQSVMAYAVMGLVSPVTQSVVNTLKRALLIWLSVLYVSKRVWLLLLCCVLPLWLTSFFDYYFIKLCLYFPESSATRWPLCRRSERLCA